MVARFCLLFLDRRHATKFSSDRSVKEKIVIWFIKDHFKGVSIKKFYYILLFLITFYSPSLAIQFRIFNLILKLLSCILYIVQAVLDPRPDKNINK